MCKWIQCLEKPLYYSNYTYYIAQTYDSNKSLLDFGQNKQKKYAPKKSKHLIIIYTFKFSYYDIDKFEPKL